MEDSNSTEQQQQSATGGLIGEQQQPPQNLDNNPSPTKRARAEHDEESQNNNNNNNNTTSSGSNNDEDYFGGVDDEQLLQHMSEVDPDHSLRANLFTVYCSNDCCRQQLLKRRGSNLWMPSTKLIRQHLDQQHCFTKKPNASNTHKQLMLQQILLHDQLKSGTPSQATNMVDEIFPADCEKLSGSFVYCNNCGFFAKHHKDFDQHFGKQNKYNCRKSFHKRTGGTILVGAHGIKCPSDIVLSVRNQTFELPYDHAKRPLPQTPPPIRRQHNVASMAPPTLNSNSIVSPHLISKQLHPSIFVASASQMESALTSSAHHHASPSESSKFQQATQCFIDPSLTDESDKQRARAGINQYKQLLLPEIDLALCAEHCEQRFKNLAINAQQPFNSQSDICHVPIFLLAGEKYLTGGNADYDVWRLNALFRSMLYQVGTKEAPNEEMLLQGATFVPLHDMKDIVDEFKRLVLFVHRTKPTLIATQLDQVAQIHNHVCDELSNQLDEDYLSEETQSRIIETNILYGTMLQILLEPSNKLQPNTLQKYLVGRAIKYVQTKSFLQFYHPNEIGKRCNSMLRLFRHFVCGHIVCKSRDTDPDFDHDEFMTSSYQLLKSVQICDSSDAICRSIRMAKEVERKTPSTVSKGFDPKTGEVMVNQVYIAKEVWSTAIPSTGDLFKSSMYRLFRCHELLDAVLNTNNKLVMAGEDKYVQVNDNRNVDFSSITPTLVIGEMSREEVQGHINMLWRLNQGTLLYLSSGAGRGLELNKIHSFSNFQEFFNCLRFSMKSDKNVLHGVDKNRMIDHFIPPSLARYIIVLNLCLYPVVTTNGFTLPQQSDADTEANLMFQQVMKLAKALGCKENRDMIAQIMNYMSPKAVATFSTSNEFATQLHHSPGVHEASYSSTVYERDSNGNFKLHSLLVATAFFKGLGEVESLDQPVGNSPQITIDISTYDLAASRALRDPSATCYSHQKSACSIIDDLSNTSDVIVHIAPGWGKSGLWNYTLLARAISGSQSPRTIVICPYNPLLAQQELKSKRFFVGTNLKVYSITSSSLPTMIHIVQDFNLLYISVDAFALLRQQHTNELMGWGIKVIYIDEFHLHLTESYRHAQSWQYLKDLKALGTKIVLLSATTNKTADKMIANYVGMGEYITIGGASNYEIPNVAMKLRQSNQRALYRDITDHIKQRLRAVHGDFAIHVITTTKEAAVSLSGMVNSEGIKADWVTSDCPSHERVWKMRDWDDCKMQVLVSTYCLGLDNSQVKEVIVVGNCRSAADALQCAGRIRPQQQQGANNHVIFWLENGDGPIESSNNEESDRMNYYNMAGYFDCFEHEEQKNNAMTSISDLYEYSGLNGIIYNNDQCIMSGLHQRMGIDVPRVCGICDHCLHNSHNHQQILQAQQRLQQADVDKDLVLTTIAILRRKCIACDNTECNGLNCVFKSTRESHWCRKCFGISVRDSFHFRNQCNVGQLPTNQQSCPFCYMAVGNNITGSGDLSEHDQAGKCVFKERVKRILLHEVIGNKDQGLRAKQILGPVLMNQELWVALMAKNIRKIQNNRN